LVRDGQRVARLLVDGRRELLIEDDAAGAVVPLGERIEIRAKAVCPGVPLRPSSARPTKRSVEESFSEVPTLPENVVLSKSLFGTLLEVVN